jgi:AraC family transcriptional regulator
MNAVFPLPGPSNIDLGSNAILARLLIDASEALDDDIERVRASLSRAVALVDGASTLGAPIGQRGLVPWQVRKISVLIEEKLEHGVRTPELAARVGLSSSHFSRVFRTYFGRSPRQYILEKRVARAQRLMLEGRVRLSEVARACGFADQSHLCRTFRRLVGASPLVWRRAHMALCGG